MRPELKAERKKERQDFGRYLKGQMMKFDLKTRDICEITGASQQAVSFWVRGVWMPNPERYKKLMDFFEKKNKKSKITTLLFLV